MSGSPDQEQEAARARLLAELQRIRSLPDWAEQARALRAIRSTPLMKAAGFKDFTDWTVRMAGDAGWGSPNTIRNVSRFSEKVARFDDIGIAVVGQIGRLSADTKQTTSEANARLTLREFELIANVDEETLGRISAEYQAGACLSDLARRYGRPDRSHNVRSARAAVDAIRDILPKLGYVPNEYRIQQDVVVRNPIRVDYVVVELPANQSDCIIISPVKELAYFKKEIYRILACSTLFRRCWVVLVAEESSRNKEEAIHLLIGLHRTNIGILLRDGADGPIEPRHYAIPEKPLLDWAEEGGAG